MLTRCEKNFERAEKFGFGLQRTACAFNFLCETTKQAFQYTSFDPLTEPVINFIQEAEQLPLLSFSEVTLDNVSAAIDHFLTDAADGTR